MRIALLEDAADVALQVQEQPLAQEVHQQAWRLQKKPQHVDDSFNQAAKGSGVSWRELTRKRNYVAEECGDGEMLHSLGIARARRL